MALKNLCASFLYFEGFSFYKILIKENIFTTRELKNMQATSMIVQINAY